MNRALARLVPDGLAARFALLLAAALIAANLVALALLSAERARLGREARDDRAIERVVGLVFALEAVAPALEAVAPALREAITHDASTRVARIEVDSDPIIETGHGDARSRALAARLAESLGPREVRVAIFERGRDERGSDRRADEPDRPPSRPEHETIALSIALDVPSEESAETLWLSVTAHGGGSRGGVREEVFLLFLGASLASVLGVGLLFVRRLTEPLARLAVAARAAGRGDRSARVPERGARELREAAAAFNAMQARIARFDAERTRTVAAVGHDLRTPITSLRIRAEMLDDEAREPMIRTLEEMAVMAEGLVAWSRDRNEVEKRRAVALDELLRRLCEERGARFEASASSLVSGQPVALSRAIGNLIDNAIRYGNVARVHLSRRDVTRREAYAVIRVEDDGPGVPPERLADVFEPFVRGEGSRDAERGGAGLGLSIACSVVHAHGGTIELANVASGGLAATVRLPVAD